MILLPNLNCSLLSMFYRTVVGKEEYKHIGIIPDAASIETEISM